MSTPRYPDDDLLHRYVVISSCAPVVAIDSRPSLGLRGTLNEPIRDVRDIEFTICQHDAPPDTHATTGRKHVGYIDRLRPVNVVVFCAPAEFDFVWSLALSGHLMHASILITKPRHGKASVLHCSFSKEPDE